MVRVDLSCPITYPKNSTLCVAPGPLPPCRTQEAGDDWLGGMPRLLLLAGCSYRDWGIGWGKEAAFFSALTPTLESRGPFPYIFFSSRHKVRRKGELDQPVLGKIRYGMPMMTPCPMVVPGIALPVHDSPATVDRCFCNH